LRAEFEAQSAYHSVARRALPEHAAASLFIEHGFSPKRVQALMGHSTIQITFDTYGHLFPATEDNRAAMERLQARLAEQDDSRE
jgi:integrase